MNTTMAFFGGVVLMVLLYFIYTKVMESRNKKPSGKGSGGGTKPGTKLP